MNSPFPTDRPLQDRAEELFVAVFSLPVEGRSAEVERACAGDPALRNAVGALLAAFDEPLGVLRQAEQGPDLGSILSVLPRKIGEFHILELLGRGGMGVVYRAEQEHPRRHVALKVLLPLGRGDGTQRLHQEAEALGRLQHPGIAQIFAAGSFRSVLGEQPFFAMELVAGVDLVAYCRDERLDARARCELIAKVADAVQHAHDRGVMHRDLKPGNVLVETGDNRPAQPKVLDFGIARCVDPDQQLGTLTTQSGLLIGTLAYMSPEQFLLGRADARSDVYALGVMLYELLSGRLPFDFTDKSMTEVHRLHSEAEPAPLRDAAIPADLQTIAGRALAKEPGERYATAAALAADLRHFLADEPIHARPLTLAYQLRKFARRHRAFVIGVLAVMLTLVAGVVVSLVFMFRAQDESERAQRNEYIAQLRAAGSSWRLDPGTARIALDRVADRQGLEWRLLRARLDPAVVTSPIGPEPEALSEAVAFGRAEDGRILYLFASRDGRTIQLRSADTGQQLWQRPVEGTVLANSIAALSPSGNRLVVRAATVHGQELQVLDAETGALLRRIAIDKGEPFVTFTADDRYLVWTDTPGARDQPYGIVRSLELATGVVRDLGKRVGQVSACPEGSAVWLSDQYRVSAATGERLPSPSLGVPYHDAQTCTYPSPDGRWLAVVREEARNILVFDPGGRRAFVLNGARSQSSGVAFHGDRVASVHCGQNELRFWDLRTGLPTRTYAAQPLGGLRAMVFSADGTRAYCVGRNGAGWIDVTDQQDVLAGHTDYILCGALDRTGHLLATGDTSGEVRLWDLDTATCLGVMDFDGQVAQIAFDASGRRLWCETYPPTQHTIDVARWREVPKQELDAPRRLGKWGSAITSDGRRIVGESSVPAPGDYRMRTRLVIVARDGTEREVILEPCADGAGLTPEDIQMRKNILERWIRLQLAVDASERWLGVGLSDGTFAVVELDTGRVVAHRLAHLGQVTAITVLPGERRVVTGGRDGTLRFWDMDTWDELYWEAGHERGIEGVFATPDGIRLVTWSADRTARIWDQRTAQQRYDALRATDADRSAAHAWVDELWDELGEGDKVAARIDAEVDPLSARWRFVLQRQLERLAR